MTTLDRPSTATRTEVDLIACQLRAIEAWNRSRGATLRAERALAASREMLRDWNLRMEIVREERNAILERTEAHLEASVHTLAVHPPTRAVLAHRNAWLADRLCAELEKRGVQVVARIDNGARAIGCVVAEQPDLLLVEDKLSMVAGLDVVREVCTFAPDTLIGAHVEHDSQVGQMLDAGAHAAWTRRTASSDICQGMLALLRPGG